MHSYVYLYYSHSMSVEFVVDAILDGILLPLSYEAPGDATLNNHRCRSICTRYEFLHHQPTDQLGEVFEHEHICVASEILHPSRYRVLAFYKW